MIAYGEFLGERVQYWDLIGGVALHNVVWMGGVDAAIVCDEAIVVDVGILAIDSAELFLHVVKLMTWISRHYPWGRRAGNIFIAERICVPIVGWIESFNCCGCTCDGIDAVDGRKTEHVVEGSIFQHDNKDVFDGILFLFAAIKKPAGYPDDVCNKEPKCVDDVSSEEAEHFSERVEGLTDAICYTVAFFCQWGV